jgi:hypothetical protein
MPAKTSSVIICSPSLLLFIIDVEEAGELILDYY